MVVLVHHVHGGMQGAPHGQPHDGLDPLRAGLPDDLVDGLVRQPLGIVDHGVHALEVVFDVDDAGALALQLVRHAAGAEDHDLEVFRIGLDGLAQAVAKLQQPAGARNRVLDGIDGQRDALDRPLGQVPPHQRHGHDEAVVHQHLLAGRDVELLPDQRFGQVP